MHRLPDFDFNNDYDDWLPRRRSKRREKRDINPIMNLMSFMGL